MSVAVAERVINVKKNVAMPYLTENGMTLAEEREIMRRLESIRNGTAKLISAEEMWKKLGLDD